MAFRRAISVGLAVAGSTALALGGCGENVDSRSGNAPRRGQTGATAPAPKPIALRTVSSVGSKVKITSVAVGDGGVWVTAPAAVLRVDPATFRQVATIPVGGTPVDVAPGPSAVWVTVAKDGGQVRLVHIDPATNRIVAQFHIDDGSSGAVVVTPSTLFVETGLGGGTLYSVNPQTGEVSNRSLAIDNAAVMVSGAGSLWVGQALDDSVTRVDPTRMAATGSPLQLVGSRTSGGSTDGMLFADGAVWVGDDPASPLGSGTLDRIDAASGAQHTTVIKNEQTLTGLVTAFGRIWLFGTDGGVEATDIDPATGSIVGPPIALPGRSGLGASAAAGYGAIWLITGENRLIELVPSRGAR